MVTKVVMIKGMCACMYVCEFVYVCVCVFSNTHGQWGEEWEERRLELIVYGRASDTLFLSNTY